MIALLALLVSLTLAYLGAPMIVWLLAAAALLLVLGAPTFLFIALGVIAAFLLVGPLRRLALTGPVLKQMKRLGFLPAISETEKTALEAGTVWIEGELFSGKPDFQRILNEPWPQLSAKEREFLEGPVEEVCRLTDDWETFRRRDLSDEVWTYLREHGFFGMIIPESFGGLGFSPNAVSQVIAKLCSRCGPLGITAMIPNSLGPGELISHYGTEDQKKYWLPRLASGQELPCFALTEPGAGSDAGSMTSKAEVFRGEDGTPMLRLTWNKRYISLSGRATVLGLAVKLSDPENLLGAGTKPGITCLLLPADTPGVIRDRRHDPLGVPFSNCPLQGENVVVPASSIIGGNAGAGQGWRMLMECLAAGRGIMLPAQATAGVKMAARVAGAYSTIRKQFGLPIGRFEGVQEPLARLGGAAYTLGSALPFTSSGLSNGKPAVVSAIAKYQFTEMFRKGIMDGMDVMAGAAISKGPRNVLAHPHQAAPIAITVEGANILTRTLMIFGQGAIRCHPYAYAEIRAAEANDVKGFDKAFRGHVLLVVRNAVRSLVLSLTRGRLARVPFSGESAGYARKLSWASATFAFTADVAMAMLGGNLKRKEALTGRFSDVFSWLYLGTCVLRRFEQDGRKDEDRPFLHYTMEHALSEIQIAMDGIFRNLGVPVVGWLYKGPIALWSRLNPLSSGPSDHQAQQIAEALQTPDARRERLLDGLYLPKRADDAVRRFEDAFRLCHEADQLLAKVRAAILDGRVSKGRPAARVPEAVERGVLTAEEAARITAAEAAREDAIQVDSFSAEEYMATAARDAGAGASSARAGRTDPKPADSLRV